MRPLLWKTAGRFLKKLKIELEYDPAITLLGIYPREIKRLSKRYLHAHVYHSIIHIQVYTHTHIYTVQYYAAMTKKEIMPFAATWTDLEDIMLSEVSQSEKDRYHMVLLICVI